ncbi:hypothetical protein ILYODFUR_007228 [Ilyodon furcidens]|uniref:Uncharacterized protein n=1 Tax=Ilyodon furcidens TaxID=33524 RepID=A0ABV0UE14_9TELE
MVDKKQRQAVLFKKIYMKILIHPSFHNLVIYTICINEGQVCRGMPPGYFGGREEDGGVAVLCVGEHLPPTPQDCFCSGEFLQWQVGAPKVSEGALSLLLSFRSYQAL